MTVLPSLTAKFISQSKLNIDNTFSSTFSSTLSALVLKPSCDVLKLSSIKPLARQQTRGFTAHALGVAEALLTGDVLSGCIIKPLMQQKNQQVHHSHACECECV
jgi:hypothetical protein